MTKTPKNYFNFRVIKEIDSTGHPYYSIKGVHYSNYGKKISGWDSEPLTVTFGQGDSISSYLNVIARSATMPVLLISGDTLVEESSRPAEMVVSL